MLRPLLLLLLLLPATCKAILTEEDIVAKEIAWVKKAVRHYRHGFRDEHPLNWSIEQELDPSSFVMPEHHPVAEELRSRLSLRGSSAP